MTKDAHFRSVLGSCADLEGATQTELGVAGRSVVDGSEGRDQARTHLGDDGAALGGSERTGFFGLLDPRGDFEVRLTAVAAGREGGVGGEAETHAAFLALGDYHG